MPISDSAIVHPTAIVEEGARVGDYCQVGPFSIIGPNVTLRPKVVVKPHAVVIGQTEIGEETVIFSFACVGEIPQDRKFRGEITELKIGKRNKIREGATLNTGTTGGGGLTLVGDDCLFMTGAHVGHDCKVGNNVVMANQAALGGHCVIGDNVTIGGLSGIHQSTRIGAGAIIGAVCIVRHDVIPYGLVQGPGALLTGLNLVGLRRRGENKQAIADLQRAYRQLAESADPFIDRIAALGQTELQTTLVDDVMQFVNSGSRRSYLTPEIRFDTNAN